LRRIATQFFNEIGSVKRDAFPGITMSNRSAKFVCALFVSILAGANFGAVAENGTKPADNSKSADNCLSGPKGAAPAGSHWYYRLDRATKRQCWYVGEAKSKAARAAPRGSAQSTQAADNAPPQQNPTISKSVADARAEWTSPKSSGAPNTDVTGSIAAADTGPRTAASDNTQSSAIGSRWPDGSEVSSSNNPQLAADDLAASPQTNATSAPQPAVSPIALTAAHAPSAKPSNSTQMLLIVMASALAFSGLVAAMIFGFNRKPAAPADVRDDHPPAPWDFPHIDRPSLPRFMHEEVPIRRAGGAQAPRATGDAEKQIAEMLSRLARGASA
jgi:hypothetical protein